MLKQLSGCFFLLACVLAGTPLARAVENGNTAELLSGLLRQHNAIMLLIDAESGRIVDANEAASDFYGYPPAVLKALSIQDINAFNPEEIARERQLAQSEKRNYFMFPHRLADGKTRTVEVYSAPVKLGDERKLLLSIIHDASGKQLPQTELLDYQERLRQLVDERTAQITRQQSERQLFFLVAVAAQFLLIVALVYAIRRRRRAERSLLARQDELQESEAYNRLLFSDSQQALVVIDGESGRFIDCNDAAVQIYGATSRAAVLGLTPAEVSTPFQPDGTPSGIAAEQQIKRCLSDGLAVFPWRHQRSTGEIWEAEVRLMKFHYHGKTLLQFSLTDITERLHNERQLADYRDNLEQMVDARTHELVEALAAADAASRAKSAFLANMSHEIRTPLNGIVGMVYLLRRDNPSPSQDERLQTIIHSAQHLLDIINDILDLSRIEADKLCIEEAELQPARLIDEAVTMLAGKAQEKQLQLLVDYDAAPISVLGDPVRLKQALLNYLGNAIKFTDQGRIRIGCRCLEESPDSLLLRFEVQDSGIGIAPEALERLFSPFEQADNSTTRRFGGTGLGLAITQRLARLMHGEAGVDSMPGAGSTFWFTARLRRPDSRPQPLLVAPAPSPATEPAALAGKRLLLVEDEPINREVAREILQELGLVIDTAENGELAIVKARAFAYDLILMDIRMPGLDGLEATRQIRRLARGGAVPIVALTANSFVADREDCLAAGMNDFVPKPFDPDFLLATVRHWLGESMSKNRPPAVESTPIPNTYPASP